MHVTKMFSVCCFLCTLLSLSGSSGCLTQVWLQQPQEQWYPVLQVHAGSVCVSIIHQTLTWTTGSFLCMRIHNRGWVHQFWLGKTQKCVFCSWWGSNLGSLDLESNALPIEPPHHPTEKRTALWQSHTCCLFCSCKQDTAWQLHHNCN